MPISRVVINASPLITLFASNQQHFLPQLFDEVIVPDAVWQEVVEGGHNDLAAKRVQSTGWLLKTKVSSISPAIISWDLGKGETSVIGYANLHHEYHVIIDDAAARKCAKTFGIKSLGTLGVLLLAKRRGILSSIKPAINLLQEAGLWLGDDLIKMVLNEAGEL